MKCAKKEIKVTNGKMVHSELLMFSDKDNDVECQSNLDK
jgi:hypothetical protein